MLVVFLLVRLLLVVEVWIEFAWLVGDAKRNTTDLVIDND